MEDSDDPDFIILCDCVVSWQTDKAVLVDHDGEQRWIPRSLLRYPDEDLAGHEGNIEVREWFARKEGMY